MPPLQPLLRRPWNEHVWEEPDLPPLEWGPNSRAGQLEYFAALARTQCSEVFADYILSLRDRNVLSARQACLVFYWAMR